LSPSPSLGNLNVTDKLRVEWFKVVVRKAACMHLIFGEAVRDSCVLPQLTDAV
jgi:hypothetical protein